MTESQPKPGDATGIPNPAPGQAPGQTPPVPAVPGNAQTPPAGVIPPAPAVPLDRQTPTPGVPGDQTVPLRALQDEREKRQSLQTQVDQLTQQVQSIGQPNAGTTYVANQQPQAAPQSTIDQQRAQIDQLWQTDPRQAVKAEISSSLSYYDNVNANIEAQANHLSQTHPDFNTYRQTAMNYIRTLPYEQRGQNGIVELAYMVARGQNVDSILQTRETELMEKFKTGQLAGALHQPAGASGVPLTPAAGTTLTQDQIVAANAMGMTEADYIANMSGATR